MAVAGEPWQLECEKMEQRCGYLLTSGLWSDCTFMVGSETNQAAIPAHKIILAMASPVFEAMFYGGLSERNDPIVSIPDVQPEAFRALLQYIYTGNVDIGSFDIAWDLWYGAKKYMLPHLVNKCNTYISSVLGPSNACRAYEFAGLFDEKTLMDKCMEIITTNTKEVLNDSSFEDVDLNTLITVFSLDHLNVDSELDLFNAVVRYAKSEHRMQRQISLPVEGGPPSEKLSDKLLLLSVEGSSQTNPAADLDSNPSTEANTPEPTADKKKLKEEEPTIRGALQRIRFLSLSAEQFVKGPVRSGLLTKDESLAVITNIVCRDSGPMPAGFSECRESRSDSTNQCFKSGCLEHIIQALKCGIPSQVQDAAEAAGQILREDSRIQQALDKGILDALGPALTEGDDECKDSAACAIYNLGESASPSQLHMLTETAAMEPFCRLLESGGDACYVLRVLTKMLEKVEHNTKHALLIRLREIGVPPLLKITVQEDEEESNRKLANDLLLTHFLDEQ